MKIACVQANAELCLTEDQFRKKVARLVRIALFNHADLVVFPEGISFWVDFAKPNLRASTVLANADSKDVTITSVRSIVERISDWVLRHLRLDFMGSLLAQSKHNAIIDKAFADISEHYGVAIVAGSQYVQKPSGMYHVSRTYNEKGKVVYEAYKRHLMPIEKSWGIHPGSSSEVCRLNGVTFGVAICFDVQPDVCQELASKGAQFVLVPSAGWRPFPGYPFDVATDMPQIERAKETHIPYMRVYQCGWMAPGLYFDGRTSIVDATGAIVQMAKDTHGEEVLYYTIK